jgi:hypothetical protein
VASWAVAATRFRGSGCVADRLATGDQAVGGTASRADGTVFPAGFLRTPVVLLRGSHPDGQCVDAERMATIRTMSMTFAAMLITAKIFSKSEAKHERQDKAQVSSGSYPARMTDGACRASQPSTEDLIRFTVKDQALGKMPASRTTGEDGKEPKQRAGNSRRVNP